MAGSERQPRPRWHGVRIAIWLGAVMLLLAPAVAMLTTDAMAWGPGDFALWGALLFGAAGAIDLAARFRGSPAYSAGAVLALGTSALVVWANLAVGFIGDEANPANLLFAAVLAVGIIGALIARFQPRGMAQTMVAMAGAQALVAVAALAAGFGAIPGVAPVLVKLVLVTLVLMGLWLASAWLFWKAARQDGAMGAA